MKVIIVPLLIFAMQSYLNAERILILSPLGSKSHTNFFMALAKPLARKGHQVTMVSSFKSPREIENITDIVLPTPAADSLLNEIFHQSTISFVPQFFLRVPKLCIDSLGTKEVQDLKKEEFDLVILSTFFDTCFLSLVHHFKAPLIFASSSELFSPLSNFVGSFEVPSMVSNPLFVTGSKFPFSFWERFRIVAANALSTRVTNYVGNPRLEKMCRSEGLCPSDMPSFDSLSQNASLTLVNSVRQLERPPRPEMPSVIYVGGCHIQEPNELPKDLEDWIETSGEHGFIFFSLGTATKTANLPESYRRILVKVFASLKQKVLWKWNEGTMEDLPPNVRLGKWLPQQDILAHPKLRLFITHGGLLSTLESTYFGVPIIGMPVFSDQIGNIAKAVSEGWALVMHWDKLEEETFKNLILQAINDENQRSLSQKRSKIMRDVPRHPADEAVYWIEYVFRHDGAEHMRSPLHHMPFYVLYNVDVYATIIAMIFAFTLASVCLAKRMLNLCLRKKTPIEKKKN